MVKLRLSLLLVWVYSYEVINAPYFESAKVAPRVQLVKKEEAILSTYLDHANTRANIDKKIGKQIIMINLHKLLLAFHVGERFMADSLSNH